MKQIIVAITGASGAIYGVRLLKALKDAKVRVHLTISPAAEINLKLETGMTADELSKLAGARLPGNRFSSSHLQRLLPH